MAEPVGYAEVDDAGGVGPGPFGARRRSTGEAQGFSVHGQRSRGASAWPGETIDDRVASIVARSRDGVRVADLGKLEPGFKPPAARLEARCAALIERGVVHAWAPVRLQAPLMRAEDRARLFGGREGTRAMCHALVTDRSPTSTPHAGAAAPNRGSPRPPHCGPAARIQATSAA